MERRDEALEADWLHGVFGVLREEVISLSADFGRRVKDEIDAVADTRDLHPPSAAALLTSVALETTNMAASLLKRRAPEDEHADEDEAAPEAEPEPGDEDSESE